jgi:hypothetical protein
LTVGSFARAESVALNYYITMPLVKARGIFYVKKSPMPRKTIISIIIFDLFRKEGKAVLNEKADFTT